MKHPPLAGRLIAILSIRNVDLKLGLNSGTLKATSPTRTPAAKKANAIKSQMTPQTVDGQKLWLSKVSSMKTNLGMESIRRFEQMQKHPSYSLCAKLYHLLAINTR